MSEQDKAEVCRCGGCEKIYAREDAIEKIQMAPDEWKEYDEPRCPYCGTKVTNDRTEVGEVAF